MNIREVLGRFMLPVMESVGITAGAAADQARTGLSVLLYILIFIISAGAIFVVVFIYRNTLGRRSKTTLKEDYRKVAEDFEKAGRFVSAANIYEHQLKNKARAAELYERGGDFRQAAFLYDLLGEGDKAREMYEKDGDIDSAATVATLEGDYEQAAKLYYDSGKKIDAAQLLEQSGRNMAAVRIYREAGDYRKASQLLEAEGMLKEAAEMFGISLRDKRPRESIDDYYAYALKLEKAGEGQMALEVFRDIDSANPLYRDVRERIHALAPPPQEEDLGSRTTLRSFIRSGKIEPKHALKLWVHILKALQEAYRCGKECGSLSPDTIAIDARNTISFLLRQVSSAYASPETQKGMKPDACSDIYSAGVILYEMLMGGLDGLGSSRIIDSVEDVPEWLDEILLKSIRKVREDRYQSIETIFEEIKELSRKKKTPGAEE